MTKALQLLGQRFNRLLVIELGEKRGKQTSNFWNCICDCGNTITVSASRLSSGDTQSCGCLHREVSAARFRGTSFVQKKLGEGGFNSLLASYKHRALRKKIEFNLTNEEFKKLTKDNCFICGRPPSMTKASRSKNSTRKGLEHAAYIYNSIDRWDSNNGYCTDNCVAMCNFCNKAKNNLSPEIFLEHLHRIGVNLGWI